MQVSGGVERLVYVKVQDVKGMERQLLIPKGLPPIIQSSEAEAAADCGDHQELERLSLQARRSCYICLAPMTKREQKHDWNSRFWPTGVHHGGRTQGHVGCSQEEKFADSL